MCQYCDQVGYDYFTSGSNDSRNNTDMYWYDNDMDEYYDRWYLVKQYTRSSDG